MTVKLETKRYWEDSGGGTMLTNSGHEQTSEETEVLSSPGNKK